MATPLQTQLAQARVQAIVDSPDIRHYKEMAARIQYGKSFDQLDAAARSNIAHAAGMIKSALDVHTAGNSMAGAAGFDALYGAINQPGAAMQVSGARGGYGTSYSQGQIGINAATSMVRVINASRASRGAGDTMFNVASNRADATTEAQLAAAYLRKQHPAGVKMRAVEFGTSEEAFLKGIAEAQDKFGADIRKGGSHESLGRMGAARSKVNDVAKEMLKDLYDNGDLEEDARRELAAGMAEGRDSLEMLKKYNPNAIKNLKAKIYGAGDRVKDGFKSGEMADIKSGEIINYDLNKADYEGVFAVDRNGGMTDVEMGKDTKEDVEKFIKNTSSMIKDLQDAFNTKDFNELQENMRHLNMETLNSEQAVKKAKNWMSRTKEYADMMGISFEEAVQQQKAIAAGMPNATGNVIVDIQRNTANLVRSNQGGPYTEEQIAQTVAQNTAMDIEENTPAFLAMDMIKSEGHRGASAEEMTRIQDLLAQYKTADPVQKKNIAYELEMATREYYRTQESINAAVNRSQSDEEGRQLLLGGDAGAIKFNAALAARNAGVDENKFTGLAEVMGASAAESKEAIKLAATTTELNQISDPVMREAVKRLRESGAVTQGDEQSGTDFLGKYESFFLESQEGKLAMGMGGSMLAKTQQTAQEAASARKRLYGNAAAEKFKDRGSIKNFAHALFNGEELTEDEALGLIAANGMTSKKGKNWYSAARMEKKFGLKEGEDYHVLNTKLKEDQSGYTEDAMKSIAAYLEMSEEDLGKLSKDEIDAKLGAALENKAVTQLEDGRTMVADSDAIKKAGEHHREKYLKSKNAWFLGTDTSKGNISDGLASMLMYDDATGKATGFSVKNANGGEDHLTFKGGIAQHKSLFKALGYSDDDLKENGELDTLWKAMAEEDDLTNRDHALLKDFEKRATAGAEEKKAAENQEKLISGMSNAIKGVFSPLLAACKEGSGAINVDVWNN